MASAAYPEPFSLKSKPQLQLVVGHCHEVTCSIMRGGGIKSHSPCLTQDGAKLIRGAKCSCLLLQLLQTAFQLLSSCQASRCLCLLLGVEHCMLINLSVTLDNVLYVVDAIG